MTHDLLRYFLAGRSHSARLMPVKQRAASSVRYISNDYAAFMTNGDAFALLLLRLPAWPPHFSHRLANLIEAHA